VVRNSKLRNRIFELGTTQTALAQDIGLSESRVSRVIRGHQQPSIAEKTRIAQALGCLVEDVWPNETEAQVVNVADATG
jgi:DNA-binding XRE family transcriptional regulator